jgi:LemA protein
MNPGLHLREVYLKGRFGCLLGLGAIIVVILILGGILWGNYNSLVTKSQAIDAQWAQVETQYQRRYDLIPNLVNSVKGIMSQEKTVFEQITEARTRYAGATTADEKAVAGGEVEAALGRLLLIMENYPELRSIEAVTQLMDELAGTENRISVERARYNDKVRDYNTSIKKFPTNLLASTFNFNEREYFKSVSGADLVPKVEF